MANLSEPTAYLRTRAEYFRSEAQKHGTLVKAGCTHNGRYLEHKASPEEDFQYRQSCLERAKQMDEAAKILEQQSKPSPFSR
jgi:hypothetical protein